MVIFSKFVLRGTNNLCNLPHTFHGLSANILRRNSHQKANNTGKSSAVLGTACALLIGACGLGLWKIVDQRGAATKQLTEELAQLEDFRMPHTNNLMLYKRNGHWIPYDFVGSNAQMDRVKEFEVRPNDIFVVSFPKSGTTWVQEIVRNITRIHDTPPEDIQRQEENMRIDERFPYLEFAYPGINAINQRRDPRLIKSHLQLDSLPTDLREGKGKMIYVVRNPKDVTVSMFHFYKIISSVRYTGDFGEFKQIFNAGLVAYGPYWKHVSEYWTKRSNMANMLIVRYEDLQKDPVGEIMKISTFLGKPVSQKQAEAIAEVSSFDNMKNNPKTNYNWFKSYGILDRDGSFMRRGKVGDWVNYFTEEQSADTDKLIKKHLDPIGLKFTDR